MSRPSEEDLAEVRARIYASKGHDMGDDYRTSELALVGLPADAGWLLAAKDDWQLRALSAEARLAALIEAARPFAEKATAWEARHPGATPKGAGRDSVQVTHRLGDFRRLREALA